MKRKTAIAVGIGAVTGLGLVAAEVVRRHLPPSKLCVEKVTTLPPEVVIGMAVAVERETELVPFVTSVDVIERGPDFVYYEVHGSTLGFPWWMRYVKSWNYEDGFVHWWSEKGSYGMRNVGSLVVTPEVVGSRVRLETEYSDQLPGLGIAFQSTMHPFVEHAFRTWLDRISADTESD